MVNSPLKSQPSSEHLANTTTTTKDNCSNSHNINEGVVKFDLGNISVPGLGSFHVKSEFSRLKPKLEREHVEKCDWDAISANLMVWVDENFHTTGRNEYFQELAAVTTLFAAYVNPIPELHSIEWDLCSRFFFWLWYIDDIIEDAIETKIPFKVLKKATDQIESILMGKYDDDVEFKFEAVPNYPIFGLFFDSLSKLHNFCKGSMPEYEKRVKNFSHCLQRYFAAQRWFSIDEIDGRYSEESFRTHRKIVAFFDGIADCVALIHGVILSDAISNSPTFKRILEIANEFGGFVNDLLGMRKEFENGQKDNLIVFKVLEKTRLDVC